MLEDVRDWVMATDTPFTLMWHGMDRLEFTDRHYFYLMVSEPLPSPLQGVVSIAKVRGFKSWERDTSYYMDYLPHSKDCLMKMADVCKYLDIGLIRDNATPLNVGAILDNLITRYGIN